MTSFLLWAKVAVRVNLIPLRRKT